MGRGAGVERVIRIRPRRETGEAPRRGPSHGAESDDAHRRTVELPPRPVPLVGKGPSRNTCPWRRSRSAGMIQRVAARVSATAISATPSALRPGAFSTGMPRAVAAAMSTLLGSPRQEPMAISPASMISSPITKSDSTIRMVAPVSRTRSASFGPSQMRSGTWSIQGSDTMSTTLARRSRPAPPIGAVTNATGRSLAIRRSPVCGPTPSPVGRVNLGVADVRVSSLHVDDVVLIGSARGRSAERSERRVT